MTTRMANTISAVIVVLGLAAIGAGLWYRSTQADYCVANRERFGFDVGGACEPGQGTMAFVIGGAFVVVGALLLVGTYALDQPTSDA